MGNACLVFVFKVVSLRSVQCLLRRLIGLTLRVERARDIDTAFFSRGFCRWSLFPMKLVSVLFLVLFFQNL